MSAEAENPAPASQAASGVSWTLDDGDLVHLPAATLEPGGGGGDRERYNLAIGARATNGYIPVFKTRHKKETKQAVFEEGMIIFGVIDEAKTFLETQHATTYATAANSANSASN